MSIIDWSDPEEMVGLLADYVRDELLAETRDSARVRFLRDLANEVDALARSPHDAEVRLREIRDSQASEFADDRALVHLQECIAELQRIRAQAR